MMLRTPLLLIGLALLLGGCYLTPVYRDASFQTPKDPPPLPQRKPAPPADFAAWEAPVETAAAPQPGTAVAVEALPPLGSRPAPVRAPVVQEPTVQASAIQPVSAQASGASIAFDGRYTVTKGGSLYGIARRFGLPIRAIIDANSLAPPYQLTLGERLTIPQARVHVVSAGDTVFNIARRYEVDRSELVRLNRIEAPYTIPLGQKLILPRSGSAGATDLAVAPQARPVTNAATDKPVAPAKSASQTAALSKPTTVKPVLKPSSKSTAAKTVVAKRGPLGKPPPRAKSTFLWPVQGPVLSSFGGKKSGVHNDGINIAAPRGTPVRAAENGVVAYAGEELKGFGKLLLIKHADGWITAYAHNERLLVEPGEVVKRGQTVARVGSTGSVPRPQLHFEVRRGTRAVNPETMMAPRRSTAAKPG